MKAKQYRRVPYFILLVIGITLITQLYWSFKNYQAGKQTLLNEVQTSLDNAVDRYYSELAKNNTFNFLIDSLDTHQNAFPSSGDFHKLQSIQIERDSLNPTIDSLHYNDFTSIAIYDDSDHLNRSIRIHQNGRDTVFENSIVLSDSSPQWKGNIKSRFLNFPRRTDSIQAIFQIDSSDIKPLQRLTSKLILSFISDTLAFDHLNALVENELHRKGITIDYGMTYTDPYGYTQESNAQLTQKASLRTTSKSAYLPGESALTLYFTNETATILKKNLLGILVSILLLGTVIACLLYVLRIINAQKQVAEIKNDLISNITHEFKTPIATIHTALESLQSFQEGTDIEKRNKYLQLSSQQLGKLNTMVEKLLETATLDSHTLLLQKEEVHLVELLEQLIIKYKELAPDNVFNLQYTPNLRPCLVDIFHFENAIDNLLDNAIKYGGDTISIDLKDTQKTLEITITDTGNSLTKVQANQLFEKFYRVPKGNTHDIKGFGLGLYYTKTIVEKHGGTIKVIPQPHTQFIISLPHV